MRMRSIVTLISAAALAHGTAVADSPCSFEGKLFYIGKNVDSNQSIWLSANIKPYYISAELRDASPAVVDAFQLDPDGFKLSFSNVVASGEPGRHTLFDVSDGGNCEIGSALQEGGITIGGGGDGDGGDLIDGIQTATQQMLAGALGKRQYSISNRVSSGLLPEGHRLASNLGEGPLSASTGPVPLTPGRTLGLSSEWQAWIELRDYEIEDQRYKLNTNGDLQELNLGIDRLLTPDLAIGGVFVYEQFDAKGYGGAVKSEYDGFSIGPYFGYRMTPTLALDGWLGYAERKMETRVLSLEGDNRVREAFASLNLTAHYAFDQLNVRPKASLFYAKGWVEDLDMDVFDGSGIYQGRVRIDTDNFNYGVAELSSEFSRTFITPTQEWMPYFRIGMQYAFEQPNGGKILDGDLEEEEVSPWNGNVRIGVRAWLYESAQVELSYGYLGLAQNGLDVDEYRLAVSVPF